jgi:hypothetical protein
MKKVIITLFAAFMITISLNAQDLISKRGFMILPDTGDFGLSIDAVPFFVYLGNFFHGSDQTGPPFWDFPNQYLTIQGKYFLNAKTAIRAKIRIGYTATTDKNMVVDQIPIRGIKKYDNTWKSPNVTYPLSTVEDKRTNSDLNIVLGAGLEKRRGKGRVQGVYGAMLNLLFGNSGQKLTYANKMDTGYYFVAFSGLTPDTSYREFQRGAISTFSNDPSFSTSDWVDSRITNINGGFVFGLGANIFIGVEYFFAPKISIGGEFSWGILFSSTSQSTTTLESVKTNIKPSGSQYHTIEQYDIKTAGNTYFGIDNDNTYGAINLSFYF